MITCSVIHAIYMYMYVCMYSYITMYVSVILWSKFQKKSTVASFADLGVNQPHIYALAAGGECKHFPEYGPPAANTTFPTDVVEHFIHSSPCLGKTIDKKTGNEVNCTKLMVQCRYCPLTRFPQLGNFTTWKNPLACRDAKDAVRDARAHVHAKVRSWHMFWFAVHHLFEQPGV